ncbi:hypothetical protein [Methanobrevibacter sp. DSM 116169]|uniref:hypothetical protein n=1 Tax=Methanobrevibacter sp. DSM 116169 TaxID=3242727 RepID=UPI0038FC9DFF
MDGKDIQHIVGIIISLLLIIGGISGSFVLRGTNSSELLIVVGFIFLIGDLYSMVKYNKEKGD